MGRKGVLSGVIVLGLTACGQSNDAPEEVVMPEYVQPTAEPTTSFAPATLPTAAIRSHNYDEVEGSTYYYIAAVSEEARKQGLASGHVSGYRYLGRNGDGEHILALVSENGTIGFYARCPDRCVIIHVSDGSRSAYNPESIIGAAFEDAIRGRLKRWVPPSPPRATSPDTSTDGAADTPDSAAAPVDLPPQDGLTPVVADQVEN